MIPDHPPKLVEDRCVVRLAVGASLSQNHSQLEFSNEHVRWGQEINQHGLGQAESPKEGPEQFHRACLEELLELSILKLQLDCLAPRRGHLKVEAACRGSAHVRSLRG